MSHILASSFDYESYIHWLGNFHPVILHFPIALIMMTVVSEILYYWSKNPLFDQASRFMIIAAAVTALPTALLGLAYSYGQHYEGTMATYFWWHRAAGLLTAFLAIITAYLKETTSPKWYYICLAILFITVSSTAFFGGELTFGIGNLWPPFLNHPQ